MRGQSTARISCVAQRATVTAMRTTSYWESALGVSGFHLNYRAGAVHIPETGALASGIGILFSVEALCSRQEAFREARPCNPVCRGWLPGVSNYRHFGTCDAVVECRRMRGARG